MSWGNLTEEDFDRGFRAEYRMAVKDMAVNHVRENDRENFLRKMYKTTNMYAGSTVWGAVGEVLEDLYDYTEVDLRELLESR